MPDVTETHLEKETLTVEVFLPGHEERTTTALFARSRMTAAALIGERCCVCGRDESVAGSTEWHHLFERSLANAIDWEDARSMVAFFYAAFGRLKAYFDAHPDAPDDIIEFIDDMTVNGMPLCAEHHRLAGTGLHNLPWPLWMAQWYGREGYQFSPAELLVHAGVPVPDALTGAVSPNKLT
jgi:hypothetical protein